MAGPPRSKHEIMGHKLIDGVPVPLSQMTPDDKTAYDLTPPPLRHGQIASRLQGGEKALNLLGRCNGITGGLESMEVVEFISTLRCKPLPAERLGMNTDIDGYEQCAHSVDFGSILQGYFPAAWNHLTDTLRILSFFPFAEDGWFQWACQEWLGSSATTSAAQPAILTYRRGKEHGTMKSYMGGAWPTEDAATTMPHRIVGFSQGRALLDTRQLLNDDGEDIITRGAAGAIEGVEWSNVSSVSGGIELWHVANQRRISVIWEQEAPIYRSDSFPDESIPPVRTEIGERVISATMWHSKVVLLTHQITNVAVGRPAADNLMLEVTYRLYLYNIQTGDFQQVYPEGVATDKIWVRYTSHGTEGPDDVTPHLFAADTPEGLYYAGGRTGSGFAIQCLLPNSNDGLLYLPLNYVEHEGVFTTGSLAGTLMTQSAIRLYAYGLIPDENGTLPFKGYVTGPYGEADNIGFYNAAHSFCNLTGD
ncbi:MAG: hypothetical protein JRI80_00150 [Deltaproteobacteria bacterium]|nr:hypothetical protein [Deltaproteobacteria bacterium]